MPILMTSHAKIIVILGDTIQIFVLRKYIKYDTQYENINASACEKINVLLDKMSDVRRYIGFINIQGKHYSYYTEKEITNYKQFITDNRQRRIMVDDEALNYIRNSTDELIIHFRKSIDM